LASRSIYVATQPAGAAGTRSTRRSPGPKRGRRCVEIVGVLQEFLRLYLLESVTSSPWFSRAFRPFWSQVSCSVTSWSVVKGAVIRAAERRRSCSAETGPSRSRKPVWAFPSIGGSNPPLSVRIKVPQRPSVIAACLGPHWSRHRWVNAGQRRPRSEGFRSLFVPSTFPRDGTTERAPRTESGR
jgi:hypothetical protein